MAAIIVSVNSPQRLHNSVPVGEVNINLLISSDTMAWETAQRDKKCLLRISRNTLVTKQPKSLSISHRL